MEELIHAETNDELRKYFTEERAPRIAVITPPKPSNRTHQLAADLALVFEGTMEHL